MRRIFALLGATALSLGLAVPLASPAGAASYPAPGVYVTSPAGVVLPDGTGAERQVIMGTVVGPSGFEVLVKGTNVSSSPLTITCKIAGGTKTAADTHLQYGRTNKPGFDSTCTDNPSTDIVLAPGASTKYYVLFTSPPPPLGSRVQISSVFGSAIYHTRLFNPYGSAGTLHVTYKPVPTPIPHPVLEDIENLVATIIDAAVDGGEDLTSVLSSPYILCSIVGPAGFDSCITRLTGGHPGIPVPSVSKS